MCRTYYSHLYIFAKHNIYLIFLYITQIYSYSLLYIFDNHTKYLYIT